MRPIVFDQTIGWLHPAAGKRGVVIAGALGFEDLCSRRFLTLLAGQLAAAGFPVLQFDYPGCGDAAGDHTQPGRLASWIGSINTAIDRLKSETSVTDVLVVGFRLGALLAPIAVAGRSDVAGMALLAPPASGKSYVRELVGLSRIVDAALRADASASDFDGVEASGFRTSAETIADLRGVAWGEDLAVRPGLDLLLMSPQTAPAHEDLAGRVVASGGKTLIKPFDGFERMMSRPIHDVPELPLSVVVEWAGSRGNLSDGEEVRLVSEPAVLEGDGYRELPQFLGPAPDICGVLCVPETLPNDAKVVLILNAGAIPHIGAARGAVDMARSLALQGIASMRVDLPGLGQSGAPTEKRIPLYDERTRIDVMRIVDWLDRYGFRRICAIGICAGAFQAFHAARHDPRIANLVMVNPLCFSWNSSYALDMELSNIRDNARGLQSVDGDRDEQAEGRGDAKTIALKVAKRALRSAMELFKSALLISRTLTGRSVEGWMRDLTRRGTRVLVVSCEGDLSLHEIARHFGPDGRRLKQMNGTATALIPAANHTLTPLPARQQLTELVRQFL